MENKSLERKSNKGWDKINKNQNILGYLLNFFSYKEVSNFKIVNKNLSQVINTKQDWSTDFQNQRRTECQILFEMGVLLRMDNIYLGWDQICKNY